MLFWRHGRGWKAYVTMGHKERCLNGCPLDLSGLDQEKLRAVVKSVMKFRVEDSVVLVFLGLR